MELKNPFVIYIGIPIIVVLALISYGASRKYSKGKKVANTGFFEETSAFKRRMLAFRIYKVLMVALLLISIISCMIMMARPNKTRQETTEIYNRDIFLCLDTSGSMYEVDLEVVKRMKELVSGLQGERFGITIFNCQTVTLVPLTTDYEYVLDVLDQLEAACKIAMGMDDWSFFADDDYYSKYMYMIDGTTANDANGSSLIGDGLASTIFQFQDLETDDTRTRVIIFSTDNQLYGTPFVQLREASELCKKYKIKVFGAAPSEVENFNEFNECMKLTGGDLFTLRSSTMVEDLIRAVEKTETSVLIKTEEYVTEFPETLVAIATIALCIYFVISRRIKA
ncbi:MAG: VWA domain-containing protein [Clostridiales bacterium]|nr:VWA domain-containing protein [Clostridiales bacterium]